MGGTGGAVIMGRFCATIWDIVDCAGLGGAGFGGAGCDGGGGGGSAEDFSCVKVSLSVFNLSEFCSLFITVCFISSLYFIIN